MCDDDCCNSICDCLCEKCCNKKCCHIFRRIFEIIFLIIGAILLSFTISPFNSTDYFIFLGIYSPIFYFLYYFPRLFLNSDCCSQNYKCKRNTYFFFVLISSLFLIFVFVIIIWGIVILIKVKKTDETDETDEIDETDETVDNEKDKYKIESKEYGSFLATGIIGLIFVIIGISSIVYEIKSFYNEFLDYKYIVQKNEKEKENKEKKEIEMNEKIPPSMEIKIQNKKNTN